MGTEPGPEGPAPESSGPQWGQWPPGWQQQPPPPAPGYGYPWLPPPPPAPPRSGWVIAGVAGGALVLILVILAAILVIPRAAKVLVAYQPPLDARGDPVWHPLSVPAAGPEASQLPLVNDAPPASGPLVTPVFARGVASQLWTLRTRALDDGDQRLLQAIERGPALEEDSTRCQCPDEDPFGAVEDLQVLVPRQVSWPAYFLAEVSTTSDGVAWVARLVIVRETSLDPWQIEFAGGDEGAVLDVPQLTPDGFDAAASPTSPPTSVDATRLPGELAAYWQYWKDHGRAPSSSPFEPGPYTDGFGETLVQYGQGKLNTNDLIGRYVFRANPADRTYVFATTSGQIACGTVREQKWWTSRTGIYQGPDRGNWGPGIAPGVYRADLHETLYQPCFLLSGSRAGSGAAQVVSGTEYDTLDQVIP